LVLALLLEFLQSLAGFSHGFGEETGGRKQRVMIMIAITAVVNRTTLQAGEKRSLRSVWKWHKRPQAALMAPNTADTFTMGRKRLS
jgi:hypothetical protein